MNLYARILTFLFIVLMLCCVFFAGAQDCSLSYNKEALKSYRKAIATSENSDKNLFKRYHYFKYAVEIDPFFYAAIWELTYMQMEYPKLAKVSSDEIKDNLKFVVSDCPQLHSSPYYLLGEIYRKENNLVEAEKYFTQFVNFSGSTNDKYDIDNYLSYVENARNYLAEIKHSKIALEKTPDVQVLSEGNQIQFKACQENKLQLVVVSSQLVDIEDDLRLIKGFVTNPKGSFLYNTSLSVIDPETRDVEHFDVDEVDGAFKALIRAEDAARLQFNIEKDGAIYEKYLVSGFDLELPMVSQMRSDKYYTPQSLSFESGSTLLNQENKKLLDAFASFLIKNPGMTICIEDYTFHADNSQANKILSVKRANTLRAYLISKGVKADRLKMMGRGDQLPANKAIEAHENGNFTEFVIVKQ